MNELPVDVWALGLAALLAVGVFMAAAAQALLALDRRRLREWLRKKRPGAPKAELVIKQSGRLLALLGLFKAAGYSAAGGLTAVLAMRYGGDKTVLAAELVLAAGLALLAEWWPRTLIGPRSEGLAYCAAWLFAPLLAAANAVLRRVCGRRGADGAWVAANRDLPLEMADGVALSLRQRNLLSSLLDLETASVEDLMTPRNEIVGINLDDPLPNIIETIQASPHTRLPVYHKTIDRVQGFAHLRRLLSMLSQPNFSKARISEQLIKPFFIPAGTSMQRQIQLFKAEHLRIGLVVDEYGDVLGLLTLEDLLQAVIGELVTEDEDVLRQADGAYLVNASISLRELNRIMGWDLPTLGPKTLNGLIVEQLEAIPKPGRHMQIRGRRLEVVAADEHAVKLVRFY